MVNCNQENILCLFNGKDKPFGKLSNKAYFPIYIDSQLWNSVEQYIQGSLQCSESFKNHIRTSNSVDLLDNSDILRALCLEKEIKDAVDQSLKIKFQDPELRQSLLDTGNLRLVYNTQGNENPILGVIIQHGGYIGQNYVGLSLENLRDEFRGKVKGEKQLKEEKLFHDNIYKIYLAKNFLLNRISNEDIKDLENKSIDDLVKLAYEIELEKIKKKYSDLEEKLKENPEYSEEEENNAIDQLKKLESNRLEITKNIGKLQKKGELTEREKGKLKKLYKDDDDIFNKLIDHKRIAGRKLELQGLQRKKENEIRQLDDNIHNPRDNIIEQYNLGVLIEKNLIDIQLNNPGTLVKTIRKYNLPKLRQKLQNIVSSLIFYEYTKQLISTKKPDMSVEEVDIFVRDQLSKMSFDLLKNARERVEKLFLADVFRIELPEINQKITNLMSLIPTEEDVIELQSFEIPTLQEENDDDLLDFSNLGNELDDEQIEEEIEFQSRSPDDNKRRRAQKTSEEWKEWKKKQHHAIMTSIKKLNDRREWLNKRKNPSKWVENVYPNLDEDLATHKIQKAWRKYKKRKDFLSQLWKNYFLIRTKHKLSSGTKSGRKQGGEGEKERRRHTGGLYGRTEPGNIGGGGPGVIIIKPKGEELKHKIDVPTPGNHNILEFSNFEDDDFFIFSPFYRGNKMLKINGFLFPSMMYYIVFKLFLSLIKHSPLSNLKNIKQAYDLLLVMPLKENTKFTVYGADTCKYCEFALQLLSEYNYDINYVNIKDNINGVKKHLRRDFGVEISTIPQILYEIDGKTKYIGGYDDLRQFLFGNFKDISILLNEFLELSEIRNTNITKSACIKAMDVKFRDPYLEQLLLDTGDRKIIYTDTLNSVLGVGENGDGMNFVGEHLMELRTSISKQIRKITSKEERILLIGNLINKDVDILEWMDKRFDDICTTIAICAEYTKNHNNDLNERKNEISDKFVRYIVSNIYSPCKLGNILKIKQKIKHPTSFEKIIRVCFEKNLKKVQNDFGGNTQFTISNSAISEIWKYISILIVGLTEYLDTLTGRKLKLGEIIDVLQNKMSNSMECKKVINDDVSAKENCIMSAVINLSKHFLNLPGNYGKDFDNKLLSSIGYVLDGKTAMKIEEKGGKNLTFISNCLEVLDGKVKQKSVKKVNFLANTISSEMDKDRKVRNRVNFFATLKD